MTKHAINHYHAPNACQNTALWIDKVFKRQTIRMRTPNSLTRRRETESEENKTDNIQSFCKNSTLVQALPPNRRHERARAIPSDVAATIATCCARSTAHARALSPCAHVAQCCARSRRAARTSRRERAATVAAKHDPDVRTHTVSRIQCQCAVKQSFDDTKTTRIEHANQQNPNTNKAKPVANREQRRSQQPCATARHTPQRLTSLAQARATGDRQRRLLDCAASTSNLSLRCVTPNDVLVIFQKRHMHTQTRNTFAKARRAT